MNWLLNTRRRRVSADDWAPTIPASRNDFCHADSGLPGHRNDRLVFPGSRQNSTGDIICHDNKCGSLCDTFCS